MKIVTIDASCEADGHPSKCGSTVQGYVKSVDTHNITNTDAAGNTREIATVETADIHFDSHSHDYSVEKGCHNNQAHDVDPESNKMPNITINGSQVYVVGGSVTTDPVSGGSIDIVDAGFNNTIESEQ